MSKSVFLVLTACLLSGCRNDTDKLDTGEPAQCWWHVDADGDGYGDPDATEHAPCDEAAEGLSEDGSDCDDGDAEINPGATEICNELDDDCDGLVDDQDDSLELDSAGRWYTDADGDGYGDPLDSVQACVAPDGSSEFLGDCDDTNAEVNPGATEVCNGLDDDCDGLVDDEDDSLDGSTATTWYDDGDGDGYGDPDDSTLACLPGDDGVKDATDCDDSDPEVNPGATEICNLVDDDCDGLTDDEDPSLSMKTAHDWYQDADGDNYGDASVSTQACAQPSGFEADDTDCDDGDAAVNPGATEVCDEIDNDCDGAIDDDDSDLDHSTATSWYVDADGDDYGTTSDALLSCDQPAGYTDDDTDCDDADAAVNPGATEVCNEIDDDCDSLIDDDDPDLDSSGADEWYADDDLDGYGDPDDSVTACDEPSGYTDDDSDCDDGDDAINPGASESCNALDDDCDGDVDEDLSCSDCHLETNGSSTYLFCDQADTWDNAQAACDSWGYFLVTINDASEGAWVISTASSYSSSTYWWIGFNDQASEGSWVWDSGESVSYTNWASSQPDNGSGTEHCAHLWWSYSGQWNDDQCYNNAYYVCESP